MHILSMSYSWHFFMVSYKYFVHLIYLKNLHFCRIGTYVLGFLTCVCISHLETKINVHLSYTFLGELSYPQPVSIS